VISQKVEEFKGFLGVLGIGIDKDHSRGVVRDPRRGEVSIRTSEGFDPLLINQDPINLSRDVVSGILFIRPCEVIARVLKILKIISNNTIIEIFHMGRPRIVTANFISHVPQSIKIPQNNPRVSNVTDSQVMPKVLSLHVEVRTIDKSCIEFSNSRSKLDTAMNGLT